ncbi:MAG TPA: hypothetical protein VFA41_12925 [Ktedonobacteraceae bacterium]|nr:hypothetical protein [Ktedonobacteraceae bacterium]
MPFTARDLRYHLEENYASLCIYLQQRAQRYLGQLAYDAFEVDQVVGHVIEQLTRLGLLGAGDKTPLTELDRLSPAQFYAFLNRSARNKAIDRLRKHRVPTNTLAELERQGEAEDENNPLDTVVESLWGNIPFPTPEETALAVASHEHLRNLLKRCIESLRAAPRQLQAVLRELEEMGAQDLLHVIEQELGVTEEPLEHASQHKDHAHKKLRHCLQQSSTNLAVMLALRLSEYEPISNGEAIIEIQVLARNNLSEKEVRMGLKHLDTEGLLSWHGEDTVRLSPAQRKRLARYYEEGE